MALKPIDLRGSTLRFVAPSIAGGDPKEFTLRWGNSGTLNYTVAFTNEYILDGRVLDSVIEGEEMPMQVTINGLWELAFTSIVGTGAVAIDIGTLDQWYESLKNASTGVTEYSSDPDPCSPPAFDIILTTADCDASATRIDTYTFPDFRPDKIDFSLSGKTCNMSGMCNAIAPEYPSPAPAPV